MPRPFHFKGQALFLATDPTQNHPVTLDEEVRELGAKIRACHFRDLLELITRWAVWPDYPLQFPNQLGPTLASSKFERRQPCLRR